MRELSAKVPCGDLSLLLNFLSQEDKDHGLPQSLPCPLLLVPTLALLGILD